MTIITAFGILCLAGILYTVFKDRTVSLREGAVMGALVIASIALQIQMGSRYVTGLNTLSLLCMIAFWMMYSRNLSRRIKKRIVDNRLQRKL